MAGRREVPFADSKLSFGESLADDLILMPANVDAGIQSVMRNAEIYYNELKLDEDGLILFEN